jgi:membrane protease YdiL (CAAX protease family)
MDNLESQRKTHMIVGVLMAVSVPFILLLSGPQFSNFLSYGYVKKLIIWVWLIVIYLYAVKIEKQSLLLWPDEKQPVHFYLVSIIAVLGLSFLAGTSQQLLSNFGVKSQSSQVVHEMLAYMHAHPILLVLTCVTAGVVEELIFRGYLIPRLTILFKNSYLPVILSALLFGAAHIGYGTVVNMLVPFLLGLIFGAYYQKYRNIKVLIFCHFFIDFLSLGLGK